MPYMLVPNRGGVVIATRFLVKGPDALLIASIASIISFIYCTNKCCLPEVSFSRCLTRTLCELLGETCAKYTLQFPSNLN